MKRSTDRILTTHVGSLPRPDDLREMLVARDEGQSFDAPSFEVRISSAVGEVVQLQTAHGLDVVNDGEESKRSWSTYARERLGGHEQRPRAAGAVSHSIFGRDAVDFSEYFETMGPGRGPNTRGGITSSGAIPRADACVAPLTYVGRRCYSGDLDNLKAALEGSGAQEAFMSAVSPGTIEHWLRNDYYKTQEEYLYAIAEAMRVEYEAIVGAGFVLQIDDPDLADAWQMHPEMDVAGYRKHAELRIEALNHGLRNVAPEHGAPARLLGQLSRTAQVRHRDARNHRRGAQDALPGLRGRGREPAACARLARLAGDRVPEGKVLIPGVVGHDSDFIESPELVADRIERYAAIAGRENVIAGTDCGLGPRVGHPQIAWAKFDALVEGARIASKRLWA